MADSTPKRPRDPMICPLAPARPLAKKQFVDSRIPPPLFDAASMYTERNIFGELVVRHPPSIFRSRHGGLVEPYPGK